MTAAIQGACLCNQVTYSVIGPFSAFHICHCSQCRRSTGSAHASNIFTEPANLQWLSGEALVKRFDSDKPGVISKSFCTHCGSTVPYISTESGKLIIPAGSLDEDPGIRPEDNIFWDDRAKWYDTVSTTPKFKGFPE